MNSRLARSSTPSQTWPAATSPSLHPGHRSANQLHQLSHQVSPSPKKAIKRTEPWSKPRERTPGLGSAITSLQALYHQPPGKSRPWVSPGMAELCLCALRNAIQPIFRTNPSRQHENLQIRSAEQARWLILTPSLRAASELAMKPANGTADFTHPTPFYCPTSKRTGRGAIGALTLNNLVIHRNAW